MAIKLSRILLSLTLLSGLPNRAMSAGEGEGAANFEVTLLVDGKRQADTWINLSEGGTLIEIPASPVMLALPLLVDKDAIDRIEKQVTASGMLTNKILARSGINLAINGPKKQVSLILAKGKANVAAKPAKDGPLPEPEIGSPQQVTKVHDDSGPWTTPPVPALPGAAESKGKPPESPRGAEQAGIEDSGWEVIPDAGKSGPVSAVPDPAAPARTAKAPVELQTYQLDRTRDELFEEVFKRKPPPLPTSVEVTLLVDGKSYGTLWLLYNAEQKRYTFPADPVLIALQGLVRRELWEQLAQRATKQTRFTVEDLIECGFPTVLNTTVFELSTGVPAQLVGTKIHSISGQAVNPYSVPAYEPAGVSAYLNFRAKERLPFYQYNPSPYDSAGLGRSLVEDRNQNPREPLLVELDGAVNLWTWVLEGSGLIWERPDSNAVEASRRDFRLVHDWPKRSLRLSAGDLTFPTSGFQSFLKLGGVGFSRDFALQPHLVAYPTKEFEFFLTDPAEVKIYINGALRGTYQLDQGTHDLQGFPFTVGESNVEIRITENTGRNQILAFSFIHEPSLLAKGNSAFSYNLGYPSRNIFGMKRENMVPQAEGFKILNYEYDLGHPAIFLDYKRGLTNDLTMEAYSQAIDTAGVVGLIALRALKIGKVKTDVAGSYHEGRDLGWAANLEYTYIPKLTANISPISWRLRAEYINKEFYRLGQDPGLLGAFTIGGYFRKNSHFANINLGASYSTRPDSTDFYNVSMSAMRSWSKGWSTSLTFKNTFDRRRATNTSVAATLNYFFSMDQHVIIASQRFENHNPNGMEKGPQPNWDNTTDLMWDYNRSAPFPVNPALSMTTSFGPSSNDYTASGEWKGNQGVGQVLMHRYEPKTYSVITNYVDLTLQSSLVYVDGNIALSRPITNSFVLVKGIENEKNCDIIVNPNQMGYDAKSSPWLPGVVPFVSPYYLKNIHIEVKDPPFGSNEERSDFTIYPGYKSGYAIYMGSRETIIALGTLLLAPGVPAEYQPFTAKSIKDSKQDPVMGFTNGAGKFQLTRMQPGDYKIEMEAGGKAYSLILTLPKDAVGIKSVGTLILKASESAQ